MSLDKVNGDLKPKTYFVITRWLGKKAKLPDHVNAFGDVVSGGPNTAYFNCICEVLGEAYPQLLVRVHDINNSDSIKLLLSCHEFECVVVDKNFKRTALRKSRVVKQSPTFRKLSNVAPQ